LPCPEEPFALELRVPATAGDHTLTIDLSDAVEPGGRVRHFGGWKFAAEGREIFTVTLELADAEEPLRVDARMRAQWLNPELELADATRLHIDVALRHAQTGALAGSFRIPWVRDPGRLADARQRLDAPAYIRALAPPDLPLAPGARVHVAARDIREGDAIGNLALDTVRALRLHGHDARLWARHTNGELTGACGTLDLLGEHVRPDDLILYQYSIRDPDLDAVLGCAATKLCFYQGITPPHLLADLAPETAEQCRRGLEDLPKLAGFDGWLAATSFTADELRAAIGSDADVRLVPPTLGLGRFDPLDGADPAPATLPVSRRFLLHVGRFAPHKGLGLLLEGFAAFAPDDPTCDLVLAGVPGGDDVLGRRSALPPELAARIHVVERASDAALGRLYRACTAYVSASEHEGFCVPLVEAMGFGKPIFAFDTPAVRETLGGAGQTFSARDPRALAALWRRVLHDPARLSRQIEGQRRRWRELREAADGRLLWEALATALRRTARPS